MLLQLHTAKMFKQKWKFYIIITGIIYTAIFFPKFIQCFFSIYKILSPDGSFFWLSCKDSYFTIFRLFYVLAKP